MPELTDLGSLLAWGKEMLSRTFLQFLITLFIDKPILTMNIGFLKGIKDKKCPIAPELVRKYNSIGLKILAEKGINEAAHFQEERYEGTSFLSREDILSKSQIIFCADDLEEDELTKISPQAHFISLLEPYNRPEIKEVMSKYDFKTFSMDMIPRTSLAQSMDCLLYTSPSPRD